MNKNSKNKDRIQILLKYIHIFQNMSFKKTLGLTVHISHLYGHKGAKLVPNLITAKAKLIYWACTSDLTC